MNGETELAVKIVDRLNDVAKEIDYDGLIDKVEEANKVQPDIVEQFKNKTKEHFHKISGADDNYVTEYVCGYLNEIIEKNELNIEIEDIVISGSRCRGIERKDSDLDIVIQVKSEYKEDFIFNIFNEKELSICGIKVDINPIKENETGTLETYLPRVEKYLEEKVNQKNQEQDNILSHLKDIVALKNEEMEEDNCNYIDGIPNNTSKKENKQEISEESESFPMKKTFRERLEEKKQRVKEMNMKERNRENKNVGIICN